MVPGHLVPHNWSPFNWSLWTNGPPTNSVPMDKRSPKIRTPWTNGPQPIWSPYFWIPTACPPGQKEYSRDHLSMGTKLVGTTCPRGPNFGGPFVHGDQIGWDHLSRGTGSGGPEVRGSNGFGTKCVAAVIRPPRDLAPLWKDLSQSEKLLSLSHLYTN